MFKIIEPTHYPYYRARIDLLIGLMQLSQDVSLSYEERAQSTFIIGEEEEGTVFGGAILNKRHVSTLPSLLKNTIAAFIPQMDHVWIGTLALCVEDEKRNSDFRGLFYKHLLKKLGELGDKKKIGFLCLTLSPREYLRTKNKEFWPYVLEINPKESLDGLFHGILSLSAQESKSPIRSWELREVSSQSMKLAI